MRPKRLWSLVGLIASGAIAAAEAGGAPPIDQAGTHRYLIPAAAHAQGADGARWVTDLTVGGVGNEAVTANLYFLASGRDNRGAVGHQLRLAPGEVRTLSDVVFETFGAESATGSILVGSDQPLVATSSTGEAAAEGALGQIVPAFSASGMTGAAPVVLFPLAESDDVRTNLGIANGSTRPLTVDVVLEDFEGRPLGRRTFDLPPWGHLQENRILASVSGEGVIGAHAIVVARQADATFVPYASTIDGRRGDAVFVSPVRSSADPIWIPAAAHAPGRNGSCWRTDLLLLNTASESSEFRVELLASDQDGLLARSRGFELGAGRSARVDDVLARSFAYSGTGALRIVPTVGELVATSRTWNETDERRLGEIVPGVPARFANGSGESARLVRLSGSEDPDEGFRTNLGAVNVTAVPLEIGIEILDMQGVRLGSLDWRLQPFSAHQEDIFAGLAASPPPEAVAVIRSETPLARFFAWASVIDNRTGSPAFLAGSAPEVAAVLPPTANFAWSPSFPAIGESVRLADLSGGDPLAWLWDFGDGERSIGPGPSHVWTTGGRKLVTLAVTNEAGSSLVCRELPVLADGVFRPCGKISSPWPEVATWPIDFDGDGALDLLVLPGRSAPPEARLYRNDGRDSYSLALSVRMDGVSALEAAVADFDSDGDADFVVALGVGETDLPGLVFFENRGDGTFLAHPTGSPIADPIEPTARDVNGDGRVDLVVGDFDVGFSVLLNRGAFRFDESRTANKCEYFGFGDLDGDGRIDAVCADVTDIAAILDVAGRPTAGPATTLPTGTARAVRLRDLNGDGRAEILQAVATGGSTLRGRLDVLALNGGALGRIWSSPELDGYPYSAEARDVDGDGHLDLLFACGGLEAFYARGTGYSGPVTLSTEIFSAPFAATDLDADGDLDVATGCRCGLAILCQ